MQNVLGVHVKVVFKSFQITTSEWQKQEIKKTNKQTKIKDQQKKHYITTRKKHENQEKITNQKKTKTRENETKENKT